MKVKQYQGNEPYIFISYAHDDTNKVMPIIERLDKDGYRLWYDEGILTAARFNNVIAERIDNCAFMLLFISDNYIASEYCNKELNFAEAENKKLIGIYERNANLTPRFKMLRCDIQGIDVPYMYDNDFFEKLYRAEDISICLKNKKKNADDGIKPYIFLSFSHAPENGKLVEPVIKRLKEDGYNIYRGDGIITMRSDDYMMMDEYAQKIKHCQLFIALISEPYMYSQHCRDELHFALSEKKRIICVYMKDIDPDRFVGNSRFIRITKAIFRNDYENEDDFFERIYNSEGIDDCKN